jgi:hypothetical protein
MNASGLNSLDPQVPSRNTGPAIRIAMLVKAKNAQKAEGEAALKLIEASEVRVARRDEVRGTRVDRYA